MMRIAALAFLLAAVLIACSGDSASEPEPTSLSADTPGPLATATIEATIEPTIAVPTTPPTTQIQVPDGFTAFEIATGLSRATSVALGPDGALYVSLRHDGVLQLRDNDGDGFYEERIDFLPNADDYDEITGLVVSADNVVYIGDRTRISTAVDTDGDGTADDVQAIITNLPVGRHQNDGLVFGPDGLLYIAFGSTCDECVEADPLSASILRANPDGSNLEVYASGIRNSYDIAFDSQGRLWATDNGSDGDETPFCATIDELNLIEAGADYGWPYAPECDSYASGTPPVASLGLHTGSTGIDAYDGSQFPAEYNGDLFLMLWGSWAFDAELTPALYHYTPGDAEIALFGTGFVNPIDVLMDTDGSLLALDYSLESLYRIVYSGG